MKSQQRLTHHGKRGKEDASTTLASTAILSRQHPSDSPPLEATQLHVAVQFAMAAASTLAANEIDLLIDFLETPKQSTTSQDTLHQAVHSRLEDFYQAETEETGEPRDRLAAPSEHEDADLGIILHCQSKNGPIAAFWDIENRSIQSFMDKGLGPEIIFGFDWHWRAEDSARAGDEKASCPARGWSKAKLSLHNELSADLLEMLPLPWVIVGGRCARSFCGKTLSQRKSSRKLSLRLNPAADAEFELEFELDIRENGIRRIVAYNPHPSAGYYNPTQATKNAAILDTTLNFLLWLQARQGTSDSFAVARSEIRNGVPGAAPLEELWHYRELERSRQGEHLARDEFKAPFLSWATDYLSRNSTKQASEILSSGESLVEPILAIMSARMASARKKRLEADGCDMLSRRGNAKIYGYQYEPFWDGKRVRITKKGHFSIFTVMKLDPLQLFGGRKLYETSRESSDEVTIHFLKDTILLLQSGKIIFKRLVASILDKEQPHRWARHIESELAHKALLDAPKTAGESDIEEMASLADETITRERRTEVPSRSTQQQSLLVSEIRTNKAFEGQTNGSLALSVAAMSSLENTVQSYNEGAYQNQDEYSGAESQSRKLRMGPPKQKQAQDEKPSKRVKKLIGKTNE